MHNVVKLKSLSSDQGSCEAPITYLFETSRYTAFH